VFIFFVVALSGFTKAWLLYLGLFFVLMVVYAPGGMASLILMQFPAIRAGRWRELLVPYAMAALAGLVALAGLIGLVEMVYRLSEQGASTVLTVLGVSFDARNTLPWFVFAAVLVAGLAALRVAAHRVGERWGMIQAELQAKAAA
jgi:branched-chain amino acid transport system permease protein